MSRGWSRKNKSVKTAEPESSYNVNHFGGDVTVTWEQPFCWRHYFNLDEPTKQEPTVDQEKARQIWDAQNQERSRVLDLPFAVSKNQTFSGFSNKGMGRYSRDPLEEEFYGGIEKPQGWVEKAIQVTVKI